MKKTILFLLLVATSFVGCKTNQISGAYNMTKCEYSYHSMDNLTLLGVNFSRSLSPASILKLSAILSGTASSIPLDMTLKINIKNPNSGVAFLNGLAYVISIDDIEFTEGYIDQKLDIASGTTEILPVHIALDVATLLQNNSTEAILNIVRNLVGLSGEKSKVTLKLKPTFVFGSKSVSAPMYYPVNFSLGGK